MSIIYQKIEIYLRSPWNGYSLRSTGPQQISPAAGPCHPWIRYRLHCLDGKTLVGLINVLDDGNMTAYIPFLLVDPAYQGKGIGKRLLKWSSGITGISCESPWFPTTAARGFTVKRDSARQ